MACNFERDLSTSTKTFSNSNSCADIPKTHNWVYGLAIYCGGIEEHVDEVPESRDRDVVLVVFSSDETTEALGCLKECLDSSLNLSCMVII
jgi:hypothetical protein